MQQIKKFEFPSFDEWFASGTEFKETIGSYSCAITLMSYGNEECLYAAAVGNSREYLTSCVFFDHSFFYEPIRVIIGEENVVLRKWYDRIIVEAEQAWENYFIKTYFVD